MVRLHSAAITLEPLVVCSWRWYLSKTTSRTQIEAVLYPPCGPKKHGPWVGSSPGWIISTCLGPLLVRVCRAWTNSDDCWEAYRSSARTSSFPCIRSQSDRQVQRGPYGRACSAPWTWTKQWSPRTRCAPRFRPFGGSSFDAVTTF